MSKHESLERLLRFTDESSTPVTIDWSGLTATSLLNGAKWLCDQVKPDLLTVARLRDDGSLVKQVNFADGVSADSTQAPQPSNGLQVSLTLSSTSSMRSRFKQLRESVTEKDGPIFYTNLYIDKIHQLVQAKNPDGSELRVQNPILVSGDILYQYPVLAGSKDAIARKMEKISDSRNGDVWIDLYPSQISVATDTSMEAAKSATGGLFTHQHSSSPSHFDIGLLHDLGIPIKQAVSCAASAVAGAIFHGEQVISDILYPALERYVKVKGEAGTRGINISGTDIVNAAVALASILVTDRSGKPLKHEIAEAAVQPIFKVSYGFGFGSGS